MTIRPDGTVKALERGEAEMEIREQPIAQASFLIRKPVAEVFEAFANPDVTTKFWLERSTSLDCLSSRELIPPDSVYAFEGTCS